MSMGWKPVLGHCGGGGAGEDTCRVYPEVGYCALTGYGYCSMDFQRRNRCLAILTRGGPPRGAPGEPTVHEVIFSKAPCDKHND